MGQSKSKAENKRYTLLIYQDEEPFINPLDDKRSVIFTCLYYDEHKKRFIEVYIYEGGDIFYDVNKARTDIKSLREQSSRSAEDKVPWETKAQSAKGKAQEKINVSTKGTKCRVRSTWKNKFKKFMINDLYKRGINFNP